MRLHDRVARFLAAHGVGRGSPVLVACSGGPDSSVLAHVAFRLSREDRLGGVTLVYVDHRLRPESAQEGDRVRALARRFGAEARVVAVEVDRSGASLERAAREARYLALDRIASERDVPVLLGHTASDQAETVLMRLLSGTGVVGLAGIPPRRGRYLRPLLGIDRAEVERYVAAEQLDPVADPMNQDMSFCRARIRHRWLPALREENPQLVASLCRVSDAAREQREVLDYAAGALLREAADGEDPNVLRVEALAAAPAAVAKRALARAAERAGAGPLEAVHQEALLELVGREESGSASVDLPGLRALREYGLVRLGAPPPAAQESLEVAGEDGPYEVRRWRPGDRMRPARLKGRSRKLSDLYTDAKLPRRLRERARVVIRRRDGAVVWAEHIGRAHATTVNVTLTGSVGPATKVY